MKRHWSFVVCDKKYLYPLVVLLFFAGIVAAVVFHDSTQINRIGNFIVCVGVWMTMRYTFREGINQNKNALDSSPVIPGPGPAQQLNSNYFNNITFSIGDAHLQIHAFCLVLLGSLVGSYGDEAFTFLQPFFRR